jgi:hypothetical protein
MVCIARSSRPPDTLPAQADDPVGGETVPFAIPVWQTYSFGRSAWQYQPLKNV